MKYTGEWGRGTAAVLLALLVVLALSPSAAAERKSRDGHGSRSQDKGINHYLPSDNDPANVDAKEAVLLTNEAVQRAKKNEWPTAVVTIKNADKISLTTMQLMTLAADGTPVRLRADSKFNGNQDVRVTVDPSLATKDVRLYATTQTNYVGGVRKTFNNVFSNDIYVVSLQQKEGFDMPVRISVKPDNGMKTGNLAFYSYSRVTKNYTRIEEPNYSVDKDGTVTFTTELGGEMIISDGPLER